MSHIAQVILAGSCPIITENNNLQINLIILYNNYCMRLYITIISHK